MSVNPNNVATSVKCKKCRQNLFSLKEYPLVDCHKKPLCLKGSQNILKPSQGETFDHGNNCGEIICETDRDNTTVFLSEEAYPSFIEEAVNEALWQKGKLHCPKCKTRLGSFNFVNVSHCSCKLSLLPSVHLHISKIDYILPGEQVITSVSIPLTTVHCGTGDEKTYVDLGASSQYSNVSVVNLGSTLVNSYEDQIQEEKTTLIKPVDKTFEMSDSEAQVRGIKDSDIDHCLVQCTPNETITVLLLEDTASAAVEFNQVSLSKDIIEEKTIHRDTGRHLRKRKIGRKSLSLAATSFPSLDNYGLTNRNEDIAEDQSLIRCNSTEDISKPSIFQILENLSENETEHKEQEIPSEEKPSTSIPDNLICPVCLDLLYSPFVVKPCSHIFCEPCLRRLAKPSPTNTSCPLCRELIGLCNPCHDISREIKENFPEQQQERHKFEKLHDSQNLPLPWLRDYRFIGFRGRFRDGQYGRNWTGWRTILWIFILDCIGLSLVLIIKWTLGDYEASLQQIDLQSKQRTLDTTSTLELESSYAGSHDFLNVNNDSIFASVIE